MPLLSVCRKTQGLIRGRSPLWLYSDLATQGELPCRGKRGPPGGCASNPQKALAQQGFPCIRCWPRHRRKHRMKKTRKSGIQPLFRQTQGASRPWRPSFYILFLLYEAKYVEYYDYHEQRDYNIGAYLVPKGYAAVAPVLGELGFVLLPAPYLGDEEADQYAAERH